MRIGSLAKVFGGAARARPEPLISYAYLWRYQSRRDEVEEREDRPYAIVVTTTDEDGACRQSARAAADLARQGAETAQKNLQAKLDLITAIAGAHKAERP